MSDTGAAGDGLLWALQERAKELNCLYEIEELLSRTEISHDELFSGVVQAIPPGWQYPDYCQAEVQLEGSTWRSPEFVETPWVLSADIVVQDRVVGRVSASYRQEMPQSDDGPFLKEERRLIGTIADRLSHFLLYERLRAVFVELRSARESAPGESGREWRVVLNLLRNTDHDLFLRISRKMANLLSWSGVPGSQPLLQGFGRGSEESENGVLGEKNRPLQKQPFDTSAELADKVFDLAAASLQGEEILARIQKWIHEDRSFFLVRVAVNPLSPPPEVADAIRRYQHIAPEGTGLSAAMMNLVRVALIRRFLSDDASYIRVAKAHISLEDLVALLERLISLPGSSGRVGGKAAGVFLASQVLQKVGDAAAGGAFRVPRSWYIASDSVQGFIRHNNLEEVYEQKYKDIDQVRLEYPHLVQLFQNSSFPPEIEKGLSVALDDLHDGPLIVRSSSLLEDRLGAVFSGKYKSLFLSNRGSKQERLSALKDAIAEVYASIFSPDPIQYRSERGLLDFREEMGILIQEVVGRRVGHYHFPAFAGVAFSTNEFRWSPRIKREDGLLRLVPGLGTRAVDRLRDDYPILVAPGQPGLRVNSTVDEARRYAPRWLDVIDLKRRSLETVSMQELLQAFGDEYPAVTKVVSLLEEGRLVRPSGVFADFSRDEGVVTFEGLISGTPFVKHMAGVMRLLQDRLGHPVDLEFASDGEDLYLLQCRPQSFGDNAAPAAIPEDVPPERVVFTANRFVSNGRVGDLTHVVYVDPARYAELGAEDALLEVGRAVSRLNALLPKRQFVLMGPGRWGSRGDIRLGVQVTYSDINNAAMLVEVARDQGGYVPDISFGTHFFQDLVEAGIRYLPLFPDDPGVEFNEAFLAGSPNELAGLAPEYAHLEAVVRVIDVPRVAGGRVLRVALNADQDRALAYTTLPTRTPETAGAARTAREVPAEDHWRWRLRMAERIAAQLDGERFGVVALYVIGSAKNATAGPASDIDLLVHVRGTPEQEQDLRAWLEGWSLCLDEMNYLRTGQRTGGLLDVHLVTDQDIAGRTSFAVKIGAATDPARPLPLASN